MPLFQREPPSVELQILPLGSMPMPDVASLKQTNIPDLIVGSGKLSLDDDELAEIQEVIDVIGQTFGSFSRKRIEAGYKLGDYEDDQEWTVDGRIDGRIWNTLVGICASTQGSPVNDFELFAGYYMQRTGNVEGIRDALNEGLERRMADVAEVPAEGQVVTTRASADTIDRARVRLEMAVEQVEQSAAGLRVECTPVERDDPAWRRLATLVEQLRAMVGQLPPH
jgi:hypothetical protein